MAKKETTITLTKDNKVKIKNNSLYDLKGLTISLNNKSYVTDIVKARQEKIVTLTKEEKQK
ncbi:hypothetical protein, partial [Staphylococcus aureus]